LIVPTPPAFSSQPPATAPQPGPGPVAFGFGRLLTSYHTVHRIT